MVDGVLQHAEEFDKIGDFFTSEGCRKTIEADLSTPTSPLSLAPIYLKSRYSNVQTARLK